MTKHVSSGAKENLQQLVQYAVEKGYSSAQLFGNHELDFYSADGLPDYSTSISKPPVVM